MVEHVINGRFGDLRHKFFEREISRLNMKMSNLALTAPTRSNVIIYRRSIEPKPNDDVSAVGSLHQVTGLSGIFLPISKVSA